MCIRDSPNAFAAERRPQTHLGVFRAEGTCLVDADVVLPCWEANSASLNPLARFEVSLRYGKDGSEGKEVKGKEGNGGREGRKINP